MAPSDGAYLSYPWKDLLAILASKATAIAASSSAKT